MKASKNHDLNILIGNCIEHFNTSLYVFLSPIIAPIFFQNTTPLLALISANAVLATAIIAKPIGIYLFGIIAKKLGPMHALSFSLIGVGVSCLTLAVLPGADKLGILAPIFLISIRFCKDLFSSGQSSLAIIYTVHNKPELEALKGSYLYQLSTIIGVCLASISATIVYYSDVAYAWRICFIIGSLAAIFGFIMRRDSSEPQTEKETPILKFDFNTNIRAIKGNGKEILLITLVNSFSHLTYLLPFVVLNQLIPLITNEDLATMMQMNSFLLIFDLLSIPLIGFYTKNSNPKNLMLLSSFTLAITSIPMWYFLEGSSLLYIALLRVWLVFWGVIFLCPMNFWCSNRIETKDKYLVMGIGNMFAGNIGKLSPSFCIWLFYYTGNIISIAIYITCIFAVTCYFIGTER